MALGRLPPAHLAACGCTQINLIWSAAQHLCRSKIGAITAVI
jgi:hypothetical protein